MLEPLTMAHGRPRTQRRPGSGFSLVELMIVIAVTALIIGLAAPSFSEYIVTQRVRSVHAQLVTDVQYARSEAASRGQVVAIQFEHRSGENGHSCYTIYSRDPGNNPRRCSCLNTDGTVRPEGSRCALYSDTSEIRSVVIENRLKVFVKAPDTLTAAIVSPFEPVVNFDPMTGASIQGPTSHYPATMATDGVMVTTKADDARALSVIVNGTGRAMVCTPPGSNLGGPSCP